MFLAQGPQCSDACEARTHSLSVSNQALYHRATALPHTRIMDNFSCSPLNTSFILEKSWKSLPENPEYAEMRHGDITFKHYNDVRDQRIASVRLFVFYLSLGLVWVCEINRIHHWCPVATEKSQPEGPLFQWETRLAEFPTEQWTWGLGFFWKHWKPMIDSFSHIPDHRVRYSISVGDVTEVNVYSQWQALYKSTWNSE